MNKRLLLLSLPIFLSISILFLTVSPTFADNDPIDPILNTETGNYYQFVQDVGISWNDAEISAKELYHDGFVGQLAVITTQDENDFIIDLLPDESSAWIGLKTTDEGFKWINEETFDYSNWSSYQPTSGDYEDYVELFEYNGKWNDTVNGNHDIIGYIVEYTLPVDPIDPVCGSENSPDINPVEYNGSYYVYLNDTIHEQHNDPLITWEYSNEKAESLCYNGMQGHLVTITDEEENDFAADLLPEYYSTLIGLSDIETEGEFKWITGEPFEYSNFHIHIFNNDDSDNVSLNHALGLWAYVDDQEIAHHHSRGIMVEFSP